ncbi:FAD-dependent oxidoreductase [Streptomyces graminofaciens]|uniref:FAD-dependent oxidoreductase n=1 Tax=Streptomyces graminofaciens TaxID=68212 RepID=A0ABM7F1Z2_9ACTN|nr:NAD(P)/FAD-dependent oxidoreductase [Streptomyces graminofaciens]BBC29808.1 FAD-dependent oxidoreductase [Streptomyces graminofaciens]
MSTAIVVGSGPNGLAAAVALAREGVEVTVLEAAPTIGGGTRTSELTPGLLHDHCSATHPMTVGSPFLRTLDLERHGLRWRLPEIDCVHPLDSGDAGVLHRSVTGTADGLEERDGRMWQRLFGPVAGHYDALAEDLMRPLLHLPKHPLPMAAFGASALLPAGVVARLWRSERARALFAGVAAHAFRPFHRPMTAAVGLMIIGAGHRHGWPVAAGGSRAISDALAALLADLGGRIETGVPVRSMAQLPPADVVLFDLAPRAVAEIVGDRLPGRVARAYRRFRHGPGAFKVDFAVDGGVPWRNEAARRAGTVHLGGPYDEVAHTERMIHAGRMPTRPFVLVGQQYLADPQRSDGDVHPVWTYAHVPHGYDGDATEAIVGQIERFAPGFRERVLAMSVRPPSGFEEYNPNYVGGDIVTGANTALQLVMRPRIALDPYSTGVPGLFICSAATPPGAGAHGMCGAGAAASALRHLRATKQTVNS